MSLILASLCIYPSFASAQGGQVFESKLGYDPVVMPKKSSTSIILDNDEEEPTEPLLAEVAFLKLPQLNSIKERVDRLIWGVRKDIKPEYDHYGYEIRRYMVGTANIKMFSDEEYLIEQIQNVRKARIIASYWGDKIEDEILIIEEQMKSKNGSQVGFSVKTAFKQNKLTVRKFIISLKAWIDANEKLLVFIYENPDLYTILYPEVIVATSEARVDIFNLMIVKQTKLKEIREYKMFEMMVY